MNYVHIYIYIQILYVSHKLAFVIIRFHDNSGNSEFVQLRDNFPSELGS